MEALGLVTAGYALVMAASPLLQVRKMMVLRSSGSVSVGYFALLSIGFALWIAYGVSKRNAVIIVPNGAAFVVAMTTIAVARRFRRRSRAEGPVSVGR